SVPEERGAVDLPRVHGTLAAERVPQGAPAAQRRADRNAAREAQVERLRAVPPARDPLDQPRKPGGPLPVHVPGNGPGDALFPDAGRHGASRHSLRHPAQAPSTGIWRDPPSRSATRRRSSATSSRNASKSRRGTKSRRSRASPIADCARFIVLRIASRARSGGGAPRWRISSIVSSIASLNASSTPNQARRPSRLRISSLLIIASCGLPSSVELARVLPLDPRAQRTQPLVDPLVAAFDLAGVVDVALAFRAERGDQQGHAGADVRALDDARVQP